MRARGGRPRWGGPNYNLLETHGFGRTIGRLPDDDVHVIQRYSEIFADLFRMTLKKALTPKGHQVEAHYGWFVGKWHFAGLIAEDGFEAMHG